ncbi:MAG: energy-coupling factor transporter transmembrane protein EcfT [Clostridiales bacterium]|nr:energy-coupling factor transporter transmembrane protein EcfT [Clostridiales bacterium]
MRSLEEYHPVAVGLYFLAVTGIAVFSMNPVIVAESLFGSLVLYLVRHGAENGRTHLATLGLYLVLTLINPVVSHNGVTPLFVVNHSPVTLEALLFGAFTAAMIIGTIWWFRSFSEIMTTDRLLCLFSAFSPKLALVFSMALRYVPHFRRQSERVNAAQRAMGLYRDDNIVDTVKGGGRVFSILMTWALENGIITADSMAARGYGLGRRTSYTIFRFRRRDIVFLALSLTLTALTAVGSFRLASSYYPMFRVEIPDLWAAAGLISYGILALLPAIIEGKEAIRWRWYLSKI